MIKIIKKITNVILIAFVLTMNTSYIYAKDKESNNTSQGILTALLKDFKTITGESAQTCEELNYSVNAELEEDKQEDIVSFHLVNSQIFPVVKVDVDDIETDYVDKTINKKTVQSMIEEYPEFKNCEIKDLKLETKEVDSVPCTYVTYSVEMSDDIDLLSDNIVGETYIIPTHEGVYKTSLITYKEDKNDYEFEEFVNSMDTANCVETTRIHKEEAEKYASLKDTVNNKKVLDQANDQEKAIFDQRKQDVLTQIENKESFDTIDQSIAVLDQTNTDIQTRLDTEAEQAEILRQQEEAEAARQANVHTYILNANTGKFHYPECYSVSRMAEHNKRYFEGTRDEAISMGYSPCMNCNP